MLARKALDSLKKPEDKTKVGDFFCMSHSYTACEPDQKGEWLWAVLGRRMTAAAPGTGRAPEAAGTLMAEAIW